MAIRIGRRQFISAIGGAAVAWPLAARAQQPALPVVGFLDLNSPEAMGDYIAAFELGLDRTGFVEGRNVALDTVGRAAIWTTVADSKSSRNESTARLQSAGIHL